MAKVIDRDLGFKGFAAQLRRLSKARIGTTVGVHEDEGEPAVVKAASNEFGTSTIPERSFLRETFDARADEVLDDLEAAVVKAVDGGDLSALLDPVGDKWAEEVRQAIRDKSEPRNAPYTIEKKGFDDPLVETGDMQEEVKHRVVEG